MYVRCNGRKKTIKSWYKMRMKIAYTRSITNYKTVLAFLHTYVASVLSSCCICCSCYTHMLQVYLQIFHPFQMYIVEVLHVATTQVQDAGACGGGPRGRSSPHVRGKRSGRTTVCVRASAYGAGCADTRVAYGMQEQTWRRNSCMWGSNCKQDRHGRLDGASLGS